MSGTRKQERTWEYLRQTGRPSLLRNDSKETRYATSKVRSFAARGMSYTQMADQLGMSRDNLTRLGGRVDTPAIRRSTFEDILKLKFDDSDLSGHVPFLGAQRRLQGLRADGYPYTFLCEQMGHKRNSPRLQRILLGERSGGGQVKSITGMTARQIEVMYDKLSGVNPLHVGVSQFGVNVSKSRARNLGYAPSNVWDLDTIDDPDAIPEWTGACGTELGFQIHKRERIPVCTPCKAAGPGSYRFRGDWLRALREKRGWSQGQLERRLELGKGHIHHWEGGRYAPRPALAGRLMSEFDVTFEELYESETA